MKIKFVTVPGNEKDDGVWEGEVSAKDMNCDQVRLILCQHEDIYYFDIRKIWICKKCGAGKSNIDGKWKKIK